MLVLVLAVATDAAQVSSNALILEAEVSTARIISYLGHLLLEIFEHFEINALCGEGLFELF
ncbi:hypothetical protein, partial [Escherichia coli]|uniref:hypothetical protein n=1 Tax=Escherichia coli TaxID=562 RepID=UPI001BDDB301